VGCHKTAKEFEIPFIELDFYFFNFKTFTKILFLFIYFNKLKLVYNTKIII